MKFLIQRILKYLAKAVLNKYQPLVIGITGSNGKTSTKEAVACVLRDKFKLRATAYNLNNEVGVPLTILGLDPAGSSIVDWLKNILKSLKMILIKDNDYPSVLVLEMAVDRPGDMKYLTSFIKPQIGIVTAIGEFPVHMEFFPEKDDLVHEKGLLIQSLAKGGLAVLNYDDLSVRMIGDEAPKRVKTFHYGFGHGADLQIANYELSVHSCNSGYSISFKLDRNGSAVPVRINGTLGKQQAFAVAAAASVGIEMGMNLVEISETLRNYKSVPGRTNLLPGIKNTILIDDSYNASPLSAVVALDILEDVYQAHKKCNPEKAIRKIAILGDMAELGDGAEPGHRQVGGKSGQIADILIAIGNKAVFIADEARKYGKSKEDIIQFDNSNEARIPVQNLIQEKDIILIKGSRSMQMEKITKEIMAEPEKADELLVH